MNRLFARLTRYAANCPRTYKRGPPPDRERAEGDCNKILDEMERVCQPEPQPRRTRPSDHPDCHPFHGQGGESDSVCAQRRRTKCRATCGVPSRCNVKSFEPKCEVARVVPGRDIMHKPVPGKAFQLKAKEPEPEKEEPPKPPEEEKKKTICHDDTREQLQYEEIVCKKTKKCPPA